MASLMEDEVPSLGSRGCPPSAARPLVRIKGRSKGARPGQRKGFGRREGDWRGRGSWTTRGRRDGRLERQGRMDEENGM